jgi:hypothetical protein
MLGSRARATKNKLDSLLGRDVRRKLDSKPHLSWFGRNLEENRDSSENLLFQHRYPLPKKGTLFSVAKAVFK